MEGLVLIFRVRQRSELVGRWAVIGKAAVGEAAVGVGEVAVGKAAVGKAIIGLSLGRG